MGGEEPRKGGSWKAFAEITALGFTFPLAIAAGYGLGWWLDRELGTGPWLTIVLTGLGVAAAFLQLFRLAGRSDRNEPPGDDSNRK
jgi:ATP synthase protein I